MSLSAVEEARRWNASLNPMGPNYGRGQSGEQSNLDAAFQQNAALGLQARSFWDMLGTGAGGGPEDSILGNASTLVNNMLRGGGDPTNQARIAGQAANQARRNAENPDLAPNERSMLDNLANVRSEGAASDDVHSARQKAFGYMGNLAGTIGGASRGLMDTNIPIHAGNDPGLVNRILGYGGYAGGGQTGPLGGGAGASARGSDYYQPLHRM